MFDLTGKTALITGASGGIGSQIATALHQQGAQVVLHGTRAEKLASLQDTLGERAHCLPADRSTVRVVRLNSFVPRCFSSDSRCLDTTDGATPISSAAALNERFLAISVNRRIAVSWSIFAVLILPATKKNLSVQ